jgi:hypothetical protein
VVLPLSCRVNGREEGKVECYCQARQETQLGILETLKEGLDGTVRVLVTDEHPSLGFRGIGIEAALMCGR